MAASTLAGLGTVSLNASAAPPYEVLQTSQMNSQDITVAQELSKLLDRYYNVPSLQ